MMLVKVNIISLYMIVTSRVIDQWPYKANTHYFVKTGAAFLNLKTWKSFHLDKKGRLEHIKIRCIKQNKISS